MHLLGSSCLKLVFCVLDQENATHTVYIIKNAHYCLCEQLWPLEWWHQRQEVWMCVLRVSALPLLILLKVHLNWSKLPAPEKSHLSLAVV